MFVLYIAFSLEIIIKLCSYGYVFAKQSRKKYSIENIYFGGGPPRLTDKKILALPRHHLLLPPPKHKHQFKPSDISFSSSTKIPEDICRWIVFFSFSFGSFHGRWPLSYNGRVSYRQGKPPKLYRLISFHLFLCASSILGYFRDCSRSSSIQLKLVVRAEYKCIFLHLEEFFFFFLGEFSLTVC